MRGAGICGGARGGGGRGGAAGSGGGEAPPIACAWTGRRGRAAGREPSFVDGDSPAGIVDGSNTTFALCGDAEPGGEPVALRNGLLGKAGAGLHVDGPDDSIRNGGAPRSPGDTLLASVTGWGRGTRGRGRRRERGGAGAVQRDGRFHHEHHADRTWGRPRFPRGCCSGATAWRCASISNTWGAPGGWSVEVHWGGDHGAAPRRGGIRDAADGANGRGP